MQFDVSARIDSIVNVNISTVNKFYTSAVFHVPPKMTKFEVSEYLTKIYNVTVTNVQTVNVQGKCYTSWNAASFSPQLTPFRYLRPMETILREEEGAVV